MGRNNGDLHGVNYRFWDKSNAGTAYASYGNHTLHAYDKNDSLIGRLTWDGEKKGEITHLSVHPDWQNKGIATGLLAKAMQISSTNGLLSPEHSATRTESGEGFAENTAKKFGMNLPPRQQDPRLGNPVGYFAKPAEIDEHGEFNSDNHDVVRASMVELARRSTPIYKGY